MGKKVSRRRNLEKVERVERLEDSPEQDEEDRPLTFDWLSEDEARKMMGISKAASAIEVENLIRNVRFGPVRFSLCPIGLR